MDQQMTECPGGGRFQRSFKREAGLDGGGAQQKVPVLSFQFTYQALPPSYACQQQAHAQASSLIFFQKLQHAIGRAGAPS